MTAAKPQLLLQYTGLELTSCLGKLKNLPIASKPLEESHLLSERKNLVILMGLQIVLKLKKDNDHKLEWDLKNDEDNCS